VSDSVPDHMKGIAMQVLARCLEHAQQQSSSQSLLEWQSVKRSFYDVFPWPSFQAAELSLHCPASATLATLARTHRVLGPMCAFGD
jgi:hypothetical protein